MYSWRERYAFEELHEEVIDEFGVYIKDTGNPGSEDGLGLKVSLSNYMYNYYKGDFSYNEYCVLANNQYNSDDNDYLRGKRNYNTFIDTFLDYDMSKQLKRKYKNMEDAQIFYNELKNIFEKNIPMFDVNILRLQGVKFEARYAYASEIHYENYDSRIYQEHQDFFHKHFVTIGEDRLFFIRMFRNDNCITINKRVHIIFETKEDCEKSFRVIKKHFEEVDFKMEIEGIAEESDKVQEALKELVLIRQELVLLNPFDATKISCLRDDKDRIITLNATFRINDFDCIVIYSRPEAGVGQYTPPELKCTINIRGDLRGYNEEEKLLNGINKVLERLRSELQSIKEKAI